MTSSRWRRCLLMVSVSALVLLSSTFVSGPAAAAITSGRSPSAPCGSTQEKPLVLAHYYIWFTPTSWNRAKTDIPLAGRYSSDDKGVMRQHVREAQRAGVDGFIVSWKGTEQLNARLADLVSIASEEDFKLEITYQGLNFNRDPLPPAQIEKDLSYFRDRYGTNPVFGCFGKPVIVLTGTPSMKAEDIRQISTTVDGGLLLLASEKNVKGYERIADTVDGNLYYWSSVNPVTHQSYGDKLRLFGEAVRRHSGIWIAPVAPGFDARLVGGESVVDRRDGTTLIEEWETAKTSLPDAIGVISWNEFSENTYIEPSENYGSRYLDVLASLTGGDSISLAIDSSDSSGQGSPWPAVVALSGLAAVVLLSVVVLVRRRTSDGDSA